MPPSRPVAQNDSWDVPGKVSHNTDSLSFSVKRQASQQKKERVLQLALTKCCFHSHVGKHDGEIQLNTQTIATHQRCTDICHGKETGWEPGACWELP